MGAWTGRFCPLCRRELRPADAVREHLITDHKRNAAEADELIARFGTDKPIPEPEPYLYCASTKSEGGRLSNGGRAAASERPVR